MVLSGSAKSKVLIYTKFIDLFRTVSLRNGYIQSFKSGILPDKELAAKTESKICL
jgi:hypothetical protein